jgi:hypothetical protein
VNEEDEIKVGHGPFAGKTLRMASAAEVSRMREFAKEFMQRIFDLEPGEYLITDESRLSDFRGLNDFDTVQQMQERIRIEYGVDISGDGKGSLATIFRILNNEGGLQ